MIESATTWKEESIDVLSLTKNSKVSVPAKRATFESKANERPVLPLVTFVVPNSSAVWIGPKQDHYVYDGKTVIGVSMNAMDRFVRLTRSASFSGQPSGKGVTVDQLTGFLKERNQKSASALKDTCLPQNCSTTMIDLRSCFADEWFFVAGQHSSQPAFVKIVSASLDGGKLRLVICNDHSKRQGTVWVDVQTKRVSRAMEKNKLTFGA